MVCGADILFRHSNLIAGYVKTVATVLDSAPKMNAADMDNTSGWRSERADPGLAPL